MDDHVVQVFGQHDRDMSHSIQIRNVPDDVHRTLRVRAAAAGTSLSDYLQSDARIPAAEERLQAYRETLAQHGIEFDASLLVEDLDEHEGGYRAASRILDRPDRPTALFCFNDRMAAGAIHKAHRLGLSVPRDLSLVGFDNEELVAPLTEPPLTTIQLPHYEMGRWAVEQLLRQIAGEQVTPEHHRVPCPLVARESVASPAAP